ncbi:MAG TPA: hypothetical protein VJ841_00520 [Candidatus Saccharimonadales bacterium]|nr:hypothetical protein [Candidatus Saccharimonadales bacterium]
MKSTPMTATKLRLILSSTLILIAVATAGAFIYFYGPLQSFAVEANHASVDAAASENNLATLQKVKEFLAKNSSVVERAQEIVADSKSYQYQDQIITDLNKFASASGLSITNVDFAGANPVAPSTSTGSQQQTQAAQPAASSLRSTSATITLKTPVDYNAYLNFVHAIEQNLTKMQISKLSLSHDEAAGGNAIISEALKIEVYIK